MRFEYESLVNMFENALLTQLRGHGSSSEFLRTWVPDPDPVNSLINMADAAEIENVPQFEVEIAADALPPTAVATMNETLKGAFAVKATTLVPGRLVLTFVNENA